MLESFSICHLSVSGRRVMDLASTFPLSVRMMKVFEVLLKPTKTPSPPRAPMLPSGACRGPLPGYRYKTDSPKPMSC